ncbi:SDR family oxidoreductase [Nocardia sp. NPDC055049]
MNEVAIVTGAAGGIGAATAQRFADEGRTVLVADIDFGGAERVAARIKDSGGEGVAVALDVANRQDWERAAETARKHGRLTALVNNAGILRDKSLRKMSDDQWDAVIDVHLKGAFLGSQMALNEMAPHGGAIVSISSTSMRGNFGQANYSAAKGGIASLMRTVAIEGGKYGVRANSVAPGTVATAMLDSIPGDAVEQGLSRIPLGRVADPAEIAAVIWFLCSAESSYVTGQLLFVDGGVLG